MKKQLKYWFLPIMALAFSLILGMALTPAFAAVDADVYGPPFSILTKEMAENEVVLNKYVKTQGLANAARDFKLNGSVNIDRYLNGNKVGMNSLFYEGLYKHTKNGDKWYAGFKWNMGEHYNMNNILGANDLKVKLFGELQNDKHTNIRHWNSITDRAYLKLTYGGNTLAELQSSYDDPDTTLVSKESEYITLKKAAITKEFEISMGSMDCECGSSGVSSVALVIVDDTAPVANKVTIAGTGDKKALAKGDELQIEVEFNEAIRFANGSAAAYDLYLDIGDKDGRLSDQKLKATLTKLDSKALTFTYTVPEGDSIVDADGNPIKGDFYIYGISERKVQKSLFREISDQSKFPLKIYGGYRNNNYETISTYYDTGLGITDLQYSSISHTTSCITDIAGNAVGNISHYFDKASDRIRIDSTPPHIERIEFTKEDGSVLEIPLGKNGELSRKDVYKGVGEKLYLKAMFNEPVKGSGDITATLNIKKDQDNYTVKGELGNEGISSYIKFDPIIITEGMMADMTADNSPEPIKITKISFDQNGYSDLVGTVLPPNYDVEDPPVQRLFVDSVAPEITGFSFTADDDGQYLRITYNDQDEVSGTMGIEGSFAWVGKGGDKYPIQYSVSSSSDKPEGFMGGDYYPEDIEPVFHNIPQMNALTYLHLKLPEGSYHDIYESKIIINVSDWAGNTSSKAFELTNYTSDRTAPEVTLHKDAVAVSYSDDKATLKVPVTASDPGGIDSIIYEWMVNGVPSEEGSYDEEVRGNSSDIIFKQPIEPNQTHQISLKFTVKDKRGNESAELSYEYSYTPPVLQANMGELPDPLKIPNGLEENDLGKRIKVGSPENTVTDVSNAYYDAPVTTLVMIKNPFITNNEKFYFFRPLSSQDNIETTEDLFGYDSQDAYKNWYHANVTVLEDVYSYTFNDVYSLQDLVFDDTTSSIQGTSHQQFANQFMALSGKYNEGDTSWHYFGDLSVTLVTGFGELPDLELLAEKCGPGNFWAEEANEKLKYNGQTLGFEVKQSVNVKIVFTQGELDRNKSGVSYSDTYKNPGFTLAGSFVSTQTFTLRSADTNADVFNINFTVDKRPDKTNGTDAQSYTVGIYRPDIWSSTAAFDGGHIKTVEEAIEHNESYDPDTEPRVYFDLAGKAISFENKAAYFTPPWYFDHINFDDNDTYIKLYYTKHQLIDWSGEYNDRNGIQSGRYWDNAEKELLYTGKPIRTAAGQSFTIPQGLMTHTGYYALEVSYAFADGTTVNSFYSDLFVDPWQPAGDMVSLKGVYSYGEGEYEELWITPDLSASPSISEGDTKWNISFGANDNRFDSEYINKIYYPNFANTHTTDGWIHKTSRDICLDGLVWVKVYNPNVPNNKDTAQWVLVKNEFALEFVDKDVDFSFNHDTENGVVKIPIIRGEENTLIYEISSMTGADYAVRRQITFNAVSGENPPSFDIMVDRPKANGMVSDDINAYFTNLYIPNGIYSVNIFKGYEGINLFGADDDINDAFRMWNNDTYTFYIMDPLGQVAKKALTVDWIDKEAPTLEWVDPSPEKNQYNNDYNLVFTIKDNNPDKLSTLMLRFEGEYANKLSDLSGYTAGDNGEVDSVILPISLTKEPDLANLRDYGIYSLTTEQTAEGIKVSMRLTTKEFSDALKSSKLYLTAIDQAGNEGEVNEYWPNQYLEVELSSHSVEPSMTGAEFRQDDGLVLSFNAPVKLEEITNSVNGYSTSITNVGIYHD